MNVSAYTTVMPFQYRYVHNNLHLLITLALITSTEHKQLDRNRGFENRWKSYLIVFIAMIDTIQQAFCILSKF